MFTLILYFEYYINLDLKGNIQFCPEVGHVDGKFSAQLEIQAFCHVYWCQIQLYSLFTVRRIKILHQVLSTLMPDTALCTVLVKILKSVH